MRRIWAAAIFILTLAGCTSNPDVKRGAKQAGSGRPAGADDGGGEVALQRPPAGDDERATPGRGDGSPADAARFEPPPVKGARFWVLSGSSIVALDLDGELVHSIGVPKGVERVIRRATGDFVGLSLGAPAEMVLFGTGEPRRMPIASVVPKQGCTPRLAKPNGEDHGAADAALELQDGWDFRLAKDGAKACALLMDRNVNMVDYGVDTQVDLGTAATKAVVVFDVRGQCDEDDDAVQMCQDREPIRPWVEVEKGGAFEGWDVDDTERAARDGEWKYAYDPETGFASPKNGRKKRRLCAAPEAAEVDPEVDCLGVEAVSSSSRWLLLHGPIEEGDYIHRDLFLFDRETGELMTIHHPDKGDEKGGLKVTEPSKAVSPGSETFDAVGESDIAALPGDRFWLDGLLLIPERRELVMVGGTRVSTAGD